VADAEVVFPVPPLPPKRMSRRFGLLKKDVCSVIAFLLF